MTVTFTSSPNMKEEYCAQIVQIGKLVPVENSNNLLKTIISGSQIVISRGTFNEGDYAIYFKNETQLHHDFLKINNLYSKDYKELNLNSKESGYFNKNGRVKMIKLKGEYSYGIIVDFKAFQKFFSIAYDTQLDDVDLSKYIINKEMGIGIEFDSINNVRFIKAYIPPQNKINQRQDTIKPIKGYKLSRIDEFPYHYDTLKLNGNIWRINLMNDKITITPKFHGISMVLHNTLVKAIPKSKILRFKNTLCMLFKLDRYITYDRVNDVIYASRNVCRNNNYTISGKVIEADSIYKRVNDVLKDYIPDFTTVYGEIIGYDGIKSIQKGYDYGCRPNEFKFMPYRIVSYINDEPKEWNVLDVQTWTKELIVKHPELTNYLQVIPILYRGFLSDLYPHTIIPQQILEALKHDKNFGMELDEPLCINKVPRDGICIRVEGKSECFKLKTDRFLYKEQKQIDAGEVDTEIINNL